MNTFLGNPQLPETDITALALGSRYCNRYADILEKMGIETIGLCEIEAIEPRLRGHADLLLLHLGGEYFLAAEGLNKHNYFGESNYVNLTNDDAKLNCCLLDSYWIGSPAHAAYQPSDLKQIAVRQRYTRCSVCILDQHSLITADHGIARACMLAGLDVLEITPGYIRLDGFNYGFIGGATFKIAPQKLAFTGRLNHHPDEERILHFLCERSIEPVFLTRDPLNDIGSAVLLQQKLN